MWQRRSLKVSKTTHKLKRKHRRSDIGCTKFHEYIYGKHVKIETDHKPLVNIFDHLEGAPTRLRRFRLDVMVYKPQIVFKKGAELYAADTLSRDCDVSAKVNETNDLEVLVVFDMIDWIHEKLLLETSKDEELQVFSEFSYSTRLAR
jgi:hypothetical protein